MDGIKRIGWTLLLVFGAAFITQLGANLLNVFDMDIETWQAAVNAGVAAVLAFLVNYVSPWIKQYGVGSDTELL